MVIKNHENDLEFIGKQPLIFEEYGRQDVEGATFLLRGKGYQAYFAPDKITFHLFIVEKTNESNDLNTFTDEEKNFYHRRTRERQKVLLENKKSSTIHIIELQFEGANKEVDILGENQLVGKVNYIIGKDSSKWKSGISTYGGIRYREVYPGIDITFFNKDGELEFDFILQSGSNPENISLSINGDDIREDSEGHLVIQSDKSILKIMKPFVYQVEELKKKEINCSFLKGDTGLISFKLGEYNIDSTLYIDPILIYSSYYNELEMNLVYGIDVDQNENTYITGVCYAGDLPNVPLIYAAKFNKEGIRSYLTVMGVDNENYANKIKVDQDGYAYIIGESNSEHFPLFDSYQSYKGGFDIIILKIDVSGLPVFSSYLGGTEDDYGTAITIDTDGILYITGETRSSDFLFDTPVSLQGSSIYVAKLDIPNKKLIYTTYLDGDGDEGGYAIAIDEDKNAYVTGYTTSTEFPLINPFQSDYMDENNSFVAKLNPTGTEFLYSTYLGGNGEDIGTSIKVDVDKNAYICGVTQSTDFPLLNPYQDKLKGSSDAFITKLNPTGNGLVFSTYLGGTKSEGVLYLNSVDLDIDEEGYIYVTGDTDSDDFPEVSPIKQKAGGNVNVFLTKFDKSGNKLLYSFLLGGSGDDSGLGIKLDKNKVVNITGTTYSTDFPLVNSNQASLQGNVNAFISKVRLQKHTITIDVNSQKTVNLGNLLSYQYSIINQGPEPALEIVFTDELPSNTSFIAATLSKGTYRYDGTRVICDIGELDVGEKVIVNITILPSVVGEIINKTWVVSESYRFDHIAQTYVDDEIGQLRTEYIALKTEYITLKAEYMTLRVEYMALNAEYITLKTEYNTIKTEYTTLNTEIMRLKNTATRNSRKLAYLENRIDRLLMIFRQL